VPRPLPVIAARHRQLVLFDAERDLSRLRGRGRELHEPPVPELAEGLEHVAVELGAQYGWPEPIVVSVRRALRLLLLTQDTPSAAFTESEVTPCAGPACVSSTPLRSSPQRACSSATASRRS
jgi:hypothetical protein